MFRDSDPHKSGLRWLGAGAAGVVALLLAAGCGPKDEAAPTCTPITVYAQGRWNPPGVAVRPQPDLRAPMTQGVVPNTPLEVNGWINTGVAVYPQNTPPWNSDVWFHLMDGSGWVSFAGVRGAVTEPDPTGGYSPDGGMPAPTTPECKDTFQP